MLNEELYQFMELIYTGDERFVIGVYKHCNTGEKAVKFVHTLSNDSFWFSLDHLEKMVEAVKTL
jgi:hypothetical protein